KTVQVFDMSYFIHNPYNIAYGLLCQVLKELFPSKKDRFICTTKPEDPHLKPCMIKLITFDIGKVLINFDIYLAIQKIAPFSRLAPSKIPKKIFGQPLGIDFELGLINSKDFYSRLFTELQFHENIKFPYKMFVDIFNNIFWPNNEVIALMHLLSKNFDIGLISNTNHLHYDYLLDQYSIWDRIKYPVLSFEVGIRKPDKRIYDIMVEKSGRNPNEILMIDDKLENVTGAQNVGFDAIHFTDIHSFYQEIDRRNLIQPTSS
ncbi:MAG: HAD family phosphatase, partial [bacterium]